MSGIGVGMLWLSYWLGLSGYSMVRGWNNSILGLANPVKLATFTTDCYTGTGVWPTGDPGDSGSCGGGTKAGTKTQVGVVNPGPGKTCQPGFRYNPKTRKCDRIPTPPTGRD